MKIFIAKVFQFIGLTFSIILGAIAFLTFSSFALFLLWASSRWLFGNFWGDFITWAIIILFTGNLWASHILDQEE